MENSNQNEFSTRMPKLGEIVIFFPNPEDETARSNHAKVCVAIITAPWSTVCVNLKIVPDHGPMQDRGSVTHFSANPAGYHFMFQDEYEMYLRIGDKDHQEIKKQLIIEKGTWINSNERLPESGKTVYTKDTAGQIHEYAYYESTKGWNSKGNKPGFDNNNAIVEWLEEK